MSSGGHGDLLLTGWDAFVAGIDPAAFRHRLERHLTDANERIGYQWQSRARRLIRAGAYAPNSPLTVMLKGSSRPLVRRGDLFQQLTFEPSGPYLLRVGVFKARAGPELVNVGLVLHEGATIDLKAHPNVRKKVWALVREALGGFSSLNARSKASVLSAASQVGMGVSKGTGAHRPTPAQLRAMFAKKRAAGEGDTPGTGGAKDVWIIPARPFIVTPLKDPSFQAFARKQWEHAVRLAFQGAP